MRITTLPVMIAMVFVAQTPSVADAEERAAVGAVEAKVIGSEQPQVQATCGGVPIKRFGSCWVLGEAPDLLDDVTFQLGNANPRVKVHPKDSSQIKRNYLGVTTTRMPRSTENDYLPLEAIHLIDGNLQTCCMSRSKGTAVRSVRDSGCNTPALDRALAVLEFVSVRPQGVTQAEIRAGLGLTANLVFRVAKSLESHGYLEREPATKRYRLTSKLLSLAQPRSEQRSLVQVAHEPLACLRDATGESAHLGMRTGLECIVLDRVIGPHPYKCYVEVGTRGPLHTGAPGKVMLAWLPKDELRQTLDKLKLTRHTATTITSRAEFEKHLQLVRRRGYAMDLGEGVEGHHCLGSPIFDAEDKPIASVWITAPAARLSERDGKRLASHVIKTGQTITEALR